MELYTKCLILTVGFSVTSADFRYEHYKTLSFHGNDNPVRKPWFVDDYSDYKPESSEAIPHYAYPYDDNVKHGSIHIPSYRHPPYSSSFDSYSSSSKKIPIEDKAFKKATSPFFTITNKDPAKYKEMVLKSGVAYCQEIKTKTDKVDDDAKRSRSEAMTCYKCKDPKNGSTYEHCSYSSLPEASTRVDNFENAPSGFRFRRSNEEFDSVEEAKSAAAAASAQLNKEGKLKKPYKFSEEYFLPEASHDLPTEYKESKLCDRVVKDSMVCMVCKDPKTNGKYEQCSYIAEPNEKAYAYTKSSSFGKPKSSSEKSSPPKKRDYRKPAPTHESLESREYGDDEDSGETGLASKEATKSSECKQIQRDSQTCTVCKDPKTGGNSERCSYAYEPEGKAYKFTKSKTFGYPESSEKSSSYGSDESDKEVSESDPKESTSYSDESGYDPYTGTYQKPKQSSQSEEGEDSPYEPSQNKESPRYDYNPATSDYIKSESEKILKDVESSNCKKVEKDSMICTVCKDPKTGGNSEQCSYSHQPQDKKFSYTKSKSFGSPTETGEKDYSSDESRPYGSSEYSDGGYAYASEHKPFVDYQSGKHLASDTKSSGLKSLAGSTQAPTSKVDLEFLDTSNRKAEIEKFLQEFQAEDRTKCQKVMRDEMTCYRCEDESGFQKEECMFIAAPEKSKDRVTYRESKKIKANPEPAAPASSTETKRKRVAKVESTTPPLEPAASASEDSYASKKKPKKEEEQLESEEEHSEAEPYEYVSETKYKYDKVLGLSLPAYMVEPSDYEKEFDDIYTGGRS